MGSGDMEAVEGDAGLDEDAGADAGSGTTELADMTDSTESYAQMHPGWGIGLRFRAHATPYEDTVTTGHDYYATFPSTNAESMTAGRIDSAAYENANTSGITAGLHAISISKATIADRTRAATTDGLSYDPVHMICPKNEVEDALMSWDDASVNETRVGNYQVGEHDDEYHLLSPNSCSELMTTNSRLPIRDLVTSNDPCAVNGFVDGDWEVRRPLIADNASDTSTL
ncbi:uncharacterized protein BDW70DRAFT_163459 [Aspergillus foveolatus]|uniref:uncharacterized protein n=1 Tax=Aspergillus foveolatus TaxID=210207 RepID=UPI003CCD6E4C